MRPWINSFLSSTLPGLGQWRNGQAKKGIAIFVAILALYVLFCLSALIFSPRILMPLVVVAVIVLALMLYAVIDAFVVGRKPVTTLPRYARWYGVLGGLVAGTLLFMLVAGMVRRFFLEPYLVPAGSMIPTLWPGDRFYADKRQQTLHRGDIVVFLNPKDPQITFVKRVVALPGDLVEITESGIRVNATLLARQGEPCSENMLPADLVGKYVCHKETLDGRTYEVIQDPSGKEKNTFPETKIPEGQIFVLGDHRDNSYDSRFIGTIPLENVVGKPLQIWLSFDPEEGIRAERIGRVLK